MITETQISEICNYLLTKKLPIDILLEVQDHFISQINSLEIEENLNFEEAFEKVKLSWRKELTLSWKGEMSLMDSTDFMRKMSKQIVKSNILKSLKLVIPYIIMIFLVANILSSAYFLIFIIIALSFPFLYSFYNYFKHFKDFRLANKYKDHILTLHQDGVLIFTLTVSNWVVILSNGFSTPQQFLNMFVFQFENVAILRVFITFLGFLFVFGGIAYSIISQRNYLKQIKRVKVFLEHHQF